MKIAVYGATGRVGSHVVGEAVARGHHVTALSRHAAPVPDGSSWQHGDLGDPEGVRAVAAGHDVVVTANGPSRKPGEDPFAFAGLIDGVADAVGSTRLVVVGGAGSLQASPGVRLVDTPEFPVAYKSEALATADALEHLRGHGPELDWTYFSPAPEIGDGPRTDRYRLSDDTPAGSWISFADFAVALVDELERPGHRRARFTAATR